MMIKAILQKREMGATTTEMGLLVGLIAVLLIGTVSSVGSNLSFLFGQVNETMGQAAFEGEAGLNSAPSIASVSAQTAEGGKDESFTVSLEDDDSVDALVVTVSSDDGVTHLSSSGTGATRIVSYRTPSTQGNFSLTVTVTDAYGASASTDVALVSVKPVVTSCEEAYLLGWVEDGTYNIDPEQDGSSTALTCLMSEQGGGWTQISSISKTVSVFNEAVDDYGLSYTELYFVAGVSQNMDYANGATTWDGAGFPRDRSLLYFNSGASVVGAVYPEINQGLCGDTSSYMTVSPTVLETAASSSCLNSSTASTFCGMKMIVPVPAGMTLNSISDVESSFTCSYTDNLYTMDYQIYAR